MILVFESANFDEKVFEEPESFNICRYPNNHLAFGFGHLLLPGQPPGAPGTLNDADPPSAAAA
jgi:hypothetical protein